MIQTTRIIAVSALLLWPMTVAGQELVHFPSFEDNGPARSPTVLNGYLSRPTGEGQHPAVIFLHGCGGLLMGSMIELGESDWAGELTRRGYAVLMVDSFAPRDRRQMCARQTFDPELYRNRPRDAYGALLFLHAQPFVRPDRVGIMGWSQGGGALLFAIGTQSFSRPAQLPRGDFRAAVAFYPSSCDEQRQRPSWATAIPLMVAPKTSRILLPLAKLFLTARLPAAPRSRCRFTPAPITISIGPICRAVSYRFPPLAVLSGSRERIPWRDRMH